jgi:hypothetical protein
MTSHSHLSPAALYLPRSSPRGQRSFLKLLTRVDLAAPLGLQFVGQVLSPGAPFDPDALPRPAVILEHAGRERVGPGLSRYSFDDLWIVWRFDFQERIWIEVVRTHSGGDTSWTHDLAFLAHQRLFPAGEPPAAEQARPVIDELRDLIQRGLESVNRSVRGHIVAALDAYLACEIVRVSAELSVRKIGRGRAGRYPRIGAVRPNIANG